MKKITRTILIFLFFSIATGHAQLYRRDQITDDKKAATGIYDDSSDNAIETNSEGDSNNSGLFRSDTSGPGGRPKIGDGIGEDSPVGDGLNVLIACGIFFGAAKLFIDKRKKRLKCFHSIL